MADQPLAEVFGYRIDDFSEEAMLHRQNHLCPFNNSGRKCTKVSAKEPLGVCSIYSKKGITIVCPKRFREAWLITDHAANFFFPASKAKPAVLTEVELKDANNKAAGNIDLVLVSYDENSQILDYGAVEMQAVYITGNVRKPFESYMENPRPDFDWKEKDSPKPDFRSSSYKRLVPQLVSKGGILNYWHRKIVVALDRLLFEEFPRLPTVPQDVADMAWLVYDLIENKQTNRYELTLLDTVYTEFNSAMQSISENALDTEEPFLLSLQDKLKAKIANVVYPLL